jgi:thioredoxin:protein disulfide reductase
MDKRLILMLMLSLSLNGWGGVLDATHPPIISKIPAFLHVDQAFKVKWAYEGNQVRGDFTIAPGCYLYRDKFKLMIKTIKADSINSTANPSYLLGPLEMPEGLSLEDPFLGGIHTIYKDALSFSAKILPTPNTAPTPNEIEIEAVWQGCAEAGLCYPPVRKNFKLRRAQP